MPSTLKPFTRQILLMLSHFLTIEYNQSKLIHILILFYQIIQPTSFIFYNAQPQIEQLNHSLTKITIITRLYVYITDSIVKQSIFWIMVFVQNFIILIAAIMAYKNYYSNHIQSQIGQIIATVFSIFIYYVSITFYPIVLEISLCYSSNLAEFIVATILMIETISIMFIGELIYRRGLTLKSTSILYINISTYSYVIKTFKISQIILFYYLDSQSMFPLTIQCILNILIQISLVTELCRIKVYAYQIYSKTALILSSISIVLSFEVLFTQTTISNNYWILISLILIKILFIFDNYMPNSIQNFEIHQLKYQFAQLELSNPETTSTKLRTYILCRSHYQTCDKRQYCICLTTKEYSKNHYQTVLKLIEIRLEQKFFGRVESSKDSLAIDYAQTLLKNHQLVKAQQHIIRCLSLNQSIYPQNRQRFSAITTLLLEFLKEQILNQVLIQISENVGSNIQHNKLITDSLKSFVLNESTDQQIIQQMKKIILAKIQFYNNFLEHQNQNYGNIHYAIQFIKQIKQFKDVLLNRYEQFPTFSNQNLLKYFCLNILNDYIEAFNINKGKAFDDDKYNTFQGQIYHKIFGVNPAYFITELTSDLDVLITKKSSQAVSILESLKINQSKNHQNNEINIFLPEYVISYHRQLVESFLNNGKNKYYQQQNLAFLKIQDKVMLPIQIMVSINHTTSDKFSFILFFYDSQEYRSYLAVDNQLDIINISSDIQDSLFFSETKTPQTSIQKIIPNFQQFISTTQDIFLNQEIKLLKDYHNQQGFFLFNANIKIEKKFHNQFQCYFVELDNIRPISRKLREETSTVYRTSTSQFPCSTQKIMNINSEVDYSCEKMIPYSDTDNRINPEGSLCILQQDPQIVFNTDMNAMGTQQLMDYYKIQNLFEPLSQNRILHSSRFSQDDDLKKQMNKIVHEEEINEIGSTSSITAIKKSKYYKKFEIISVLMKSEKQSKKIIQMNKFIALYISIILIGLIIFIVMIENLEQFIFDIKILSVRYDVVEPYESFYVSRFSQVNYREQLAGSFINISQYNQLTIYPFSTFELMFNHLRDSMYKVQQREEIDQLSVNQNISIYFLENSYQGEIRNVTIRSLINILTNYQYDFKIGLTSKSVVFESPFFYFTAKNYLTIKQTFDGLNQIVLDATLQRSTLEQQKWLSVLLPFTIFSFLLSLIIISHYKDYISIMHKIFLYLMSLDSVIIDDEKQRLQKHLNIINNEIKKIKSYEFDIEAIDIELEQSHPSKTRHLNKKEQKNVYLYNNDLKNCIIITSFHFILQLSFFLSIFLIIQRYLEKYEKTAVIYQQISDLGVDIPTIYAQREVLYRRTLRYFFLSDQEVEGIYQVLFKAYDKVEEFSKQNLDFSSDQYLFDQNAITFYKNVNEGNLCDYQTDQFKDLSKTICPIVMNGNLQKGLSQILAYILQTIKAQQYETKNFTLLPTDTKLELEGATILGNVMSTIVYNLYLTLLDSCQLLMFYTKLPCIAFLTFQFICFVIYIIFGNKRHKQQFQSIKQTIFLFPRQTLIFDEFFYRNFKSIIKDEGISQ
ncbi:unnamed protein product [Paramecium primaurelia]|uniref:Transmembrane protein n=1 Tax=Paramecium primaurelia TaxID=5886 RepID=A0A8S1MTK5_PARPR|nr:unnamed protein product [Paramecium primaurelia]